MMVVMSEGDGDEAEERGRIQQERRLYCIHVIWILGNPGALNNLLGVRRTEFRVSMPVYSYGACTYILTRVSRSGLSSPYLQN